MSTDIIPAQPSVPARMLRPEFSVSEILEAAKDTTEVIVRCLEKGRDYGLVPGTKKETLFKPGAERLCGAFNVYPRYLVVESDIDHDRETKWSTRRSSGTSLGLYRYVVQCDLVHRISGQVIASGMGSCSTLESRFCDRPRDCENTVLKMSQKRAFVASVLNGFSLSDRFTQDLEDQEPKTAGRPATAEQRSELSDLSRLLTDRGRQYVLGQLDSELTHDEAQRLIDFYRGKTAKESHAGEDVVQEATEEEPDNDNGI